MIFCNLKISESPNCGQAITDYIFVDSETPTCYIIFHIKGSSCTFCVYDVDITDSNIRIVMKSETFV